MRSALRLLSGAILSLLCVTSAFAQASQTGGITGVVTDTGGALVQGATVDVINESTGKSERTATTTSDGGFSITLLKPGNYRLESRPLILRKPWCRRCKSESARAPGKT